MTGLGFHSSSVPAFSNGILTVHLPVVGGLLSAHLLSKKAGIEVEVGWPCSGPLLRMAEEAARKLLPGENLSVLCCCGSWGDWCTGGRWHCLSCELTEQSYIPWALRSWTSFVCRKASCKFRAQVVHVCAKCCMCLMQQFVNCLLWEIFYMHEKCYKDWNSLQRQEDAALSAPLWAVLGCVLWQHDTISFSACTLGYPWAIMSSVFVRCWPASVVTFHWLVCLCRDAAPALHRGE